MADIEGVIRERLAEIDSEKRKLAAALAELTSRQFTSRRRPSISTGSRKPRSARRTKPGDRPRQVLGHLKQNPGARPSEIATAIKASPNQVHAVIAKLHKDKVVRKRGKGYGLAAKASTQTKGSPRPQRSKQAGPTSSRRQPGDA